MRNWVQTGGCALALASIAIGAGCSKPAGAQSVTAQTLARRLSAARAGGRLILAPGVYGPLRISGLRPSKPLIIESALLNRPAIFSTIDIVDSANVRLSNLNVAYAPGPDTTVRDNAVRVYRSNGIVLRGLRVTGGLAVNGIPESAPAGGQDRTMNILGRPTARGITILQSTDVTLDRNDISSFYRGIVLNDAHKVRVVANYVHNLRATPLAGSSVSDLLIEGNIFTESHPWRFGGKGDHGDMIHIWTDIHSPAPINGVTIRSNWLKQGAGQGILGIYLEDNGGGGYRNVTIENNLIHNDNYQGVRVEGVVGRIVRNTLVQPPSDRPKSAPSILVTQKSNVVVEGNVAARIDHTFGGVSADRDNIIVQRFMPQASGYYAGTFRNALQGGGDPADFTLTSPAGATAGFDLARMRAVLAKQ